MGVGQAQVRSEASNQNAPALAVAAYAILLVASVKTYGGQGRPDTFQKPRWQKTKTTQRATTNQLINQLRHELWAQAVTPNHFRPLSLQEQKNQTGGKCENPLGVAVFFSVKRTPFPPGGAELQSPEGTAEASIL